MENNNTPNNSIYYNKVIQLQQQRINLFFITNRHSKCLNKSKQNTHNTNQSFSTFLADQIKGPNPKYHNQIQ